MNNKQDDAFVDVHVVATFQEEILSYDFEGGHVAVGEMAELGEDIGLMVVDLLQRHREHIEKEIVGKIKEQPEATEADGWEKAKSETCCPGDDWADGYNRAIEEILSLITKK